MARQAGTRRPDPISRPFSRLGELFDASAMGLVTLLLVGASFFATWRGMRDFIIGNDLAAGLASQGLIALVVLTLTLAMYVALRETVSPYETPGWWSHVWKRLVALPLYVLLAVWSVGFGYGFWWSVIAGESVTEAEIARVLTDVQEETTGMKAGLVAAASVMSTAERLSDEKAAIEASRGGTCGIASPPGDGPLARARAETQSQIAALSASVQGEWLPTVAARLDGLGAAAGEVSLAAEGAARRAAYERVYQETRIGARDISAEATARGRAIAAQLRAKAGQLAAPPAGGTVPYCHDPDLATALQAAADELAGPFGITVPDFRFSEGAAGVARAVEDLWLGLFRRAGLTDEAATGGPLDGRSLIALMAAIGVDLALLVFGVLRGGGTKGRRHEEAGPPGPETAAIGPAAQAAIEPAMPRRALAAPAAATVMPAAADPPEAEPIEAEFTEEAGQGLRPATFEPDSQLSEDDQLKDLLDRAQTHLREIHAAGSERSRSAARNRLQDVLRDLRRFGYVEAGLDDQEFQPGLHRTVGRQRSHLPAGHIVRVVRPRFMDERGRLILPALVIVSAGR